jgi:hypothetical protein
MTDISSIFREGCLVAVTVGRWGGPRKVPQDLLRKKGLTSKRIKGYKDLVDPETLKPIGSPVNRANSILKNYALPFPIRGCHFVPKSLITQVDEILKECREEFDNAVEEFADEYPEYVREAEEELEELFDRRQYPENISDYFSFGWKFFILDLPSGEFGVLSPSQYEEEKEKLRNTIVEARDMAVSALREQLMVIVKATVSKLKDKGAKRFHETLVTNFREFFNTFSDRNIFGDTKLEELVESCEEIMDGVEIEDITDNDQLKVEIAEELAEVEEELEQAMIRKPIRKIRKKGPPKERVMKLRIRRR